MLSPSSTYPNYVDQRRGRVVYLDVLRFIATLGVIFLHVSATEYESTIFTLTWFISLVGDSLVRWVVPVFVMISGTLFLSPNKEISLNELYKKYIWRLLKVYLFWYLFYVVLFLLVDYYHRREIILTETTFKPALHLWFIPMLIGVYSLIPILKKFSADRKVLQYALILWFIYISISFTIGQNIPQISALFIMNIVIGYAGYFLLGYYLSECNCSRVNNRVLFSVCLLSLAITIIGSLSLSIKKGAPNISFFNNLSPHIALISSAIYLAIKKNTSRLSSNVIALIRSVQKDLLGVYLIHWFWLFLLNRDLLRNFCNPLLSFPVLSAIIFILSLYTTKMIRSIPLVKRFVE